MPRLLDAHPDDKDLLLPRMLRPGLEGAPLPDPGEGDKETIGEAEAVPMMPVRMLRHKFGAVRTVKDGISFPSKAEARFYDELVMRQRGGDVLFFLRQVPFHLPGGVRYVVDFQVFHSDGRVRFVDVKGLETPGFITKKKLVEALYPVEIEVVK